MTSSVTESLLPSVGFNVGNLATSRITKPPHSEAFRASSSEKVPYGCGKVLIESQLRQPKVSHVAIVSPQPRNVTNKKMPKTYSKTETLQRGSLQSQVKLSEKKLASSRKLEHSGPCQAGRDHFRSRTKSDHDPTGQVVAASTPIRPAGEQDSAATPSKFSHSSMISRKSTVKTISSKSVGSSTVCKQTSTSTDRNGKCSRVTCVPPKSRPSCAASLRGKQQQGIAAHPSSSSPARRKASNAPVNTQAHTTKAGLS